MGFGGFFFFFIVQGSLIVLAISVVFVLLFMTGRRMPDPRGVLLPASFSLSVTLAGILGALTSLAMMSAAVGAEVSGSGSSCSSVVGTFVEGSGSQVTPLAQGAPPPPPPQPPKYRHPSVTLIPGNAPTDFAPPEGYTQVPAQFPTLEPLPPLELEPGFGEEPFPPPRDLPTQAPLVRCESEAGKNIAQAFPWLLVSTVAVGGGSRLFRTQLNEERSR